MVLDLHRHLQRHCLWHQASELIAARLIAHNDLDHCVVCIGYKSQWQGDSQPALVYVKLIIQPFETVRAGRWEFWCTNAASLSRSDVNGQWDETIRNGVTVHVQSGIDVDVDRQPETLEGAVRRRVDACRDPYAPASGMRWRTVHGTLQAEPLFQNSYARLAFAIALLETLLHHAALLVEQEHAWIGHSPMVIAFGNAIGGMVLVDTLIQQTKRSDHFAALISEQRVGDALFGSKRGQYVDCIVADGKRDNAVTLEVGQAFLQLDELRFAVGSPPGTAMEYHQCALTVPRLVQFDLPAVLVRQDDVRKALPNGRANCGEVDAKVELSSHKCSSCG